MGPYFSSFISLKNNLHFLIKISREAYSNLSTSRLYPWSQSKKKAHLKAPINEVKIDSRSFIFLYLGKNNTESFLSYLLFYSLGSFIILYFKKAGAQNDSQFFVLSFKKEF